MVAAILKSGLRIMPRSGGRVGKGIYFASENSKSACYGEDLGVGLAVCDAHRVCVSLAAFAYPLPGSCGLAKPLPCHSSWSQCYSMAWEQPYGNTKDSAIIPILSPVAVGYTSKKVGIMFLTEVALGKPYCITCDDPTLCQPPAGYDSVLACGRTEPGEPGAGGVCQGRLWGCGWHRAEGERGQISGLMWWWGVFWPRSCTG